MKKITSLLSLVLVIISLVTLFGNNVQAAVSSNNSDSSSAVQNLYQLMVQAKGQDIDAFLAQLSPENQKLAIKILTPASVEMQKNSPIVPMDSGTILTTYVTLYDGFHLPLCAYLQQITWYYNQTYITQPPQTVMGGATYMIGWVYNGVLSQNQWGVRVIRITVHIARAVLI